MSVLAEACPLVFPVASLVRGERKVAPVLDCLLLKQAVPLECNAAFQVPKQTEKLLAGWGEGQCR